MTTRKVGSFLGALVVATLLLSIFVDIADAQRRRRRDRRQRQQQEQAQEQEQEQEAEDAEDEESEVLLAEDEPVEGDPETDGEVVEPAAAVDPEPEAAPDEDPFAFGPDLGPLREQFTSIMDELVQVRSRVAVLGQQLFQTKVRVVVQNRASGDNTLARMALRLDGAPIFSGTSSDFQGDQEKQVFEGFAAPGPHVMTVEVEQRQRADDDYRYTMQDTYRFTVTRQRLSEILIILDDDSDMGEDFEDDGEAEYDVRTRFRVATRELREE